MRAKKTQYSTLVKLTAKAEAGRAFSGKYRVANKALFRVLMSICKLGIYSVFGKVIYHDLYLFYFGYVMRDHTMLNQKLLVVWNDRDNDKKAHKGKEANIDSG
ncbi:hypothetical protein FM037_09015 [Shewanella psychropiezotolerans]|uniref:Uncharacterized protein n=1 Tax=Shewanella psychropiezotolerans TaxID=2593655 RepID=A0ABX5WWD1_9GAMM|nr:hypothetical protein [Shewanella psychropiezotolerans]QDO83344.1 hypothetical protein FM037_09015 [Shewanella psychropiezotolerans]